jgi:hypothetical protein
MHEVYDSVVLDTMAKVDWHAVTEGEAASFGLALGLYREQAEVHQNRHVAWGTSAGGVISMSVLTCVCLTVIGANPAITLAAVIAAQVIRAGWLYHKVVAAGTDVRALRDQVIDVTKRIAELHPADGRQ